MGAFDSNKSSLIAFLVLALLFLAVEFRGLSHIDPGDEHVYFYMGKLVSQGHIPYRDFFFAHPPLLLSSPALVYSLFGFKIALLKSVELLAAVGSAFIIFLIARHLFNNRAALTASFLFLSSKLVLFESTYYLGMNLAVLLFLIGLYFALVKDSYIAAGLFMALCSLVRLNLLPAIAAFSIYLFFTAKKDFWRFTMAFSALFLAVNLILLAIAGSAYINSVYLFHLKKPVQESANFTVFANFMKENTFLMLAFALFFFVPKKKLRPLLVLAASYTVFLMLTNKIFNFYLLFLIPMLAITGSYAINHVLERFRNDNLVKYSILGILALVFIANTSSALIKLYTFDFVEFEKFEELKAFVEQNSKPDEAIFGDSNTATLLALATQKDIALNFPDTNIQVFESKVINLEDTINKLKASPPALIIIRPTRGIGALDEFRNYLEQGCKLEKHVKDPLQGDFLIYGCR